jgi:hypothetical protein
MKRNKKNKFEKKKSSKRVLRNSVIIIIALIVFSQFMSKRENNRKDYLVGNVNDETFSLDEDYDEDYNEVYSDIVTDEESEEPTNVKVDEQTDEVTDIVIDEETTIIMSEEEPDVQLDKVIVKDTDEQLETLSDIDIVNVTETEETGYGYDIAFFVSYSTYSAAYYYVDFDKNLETTFSLTYSKRKKEQQISGEPKTHEISGNLEDGWSDDNYTYNWYVDANGNEKVVLYMNSNGNKHDEGNVMSRETAELRYDKYVKD